MVYQWKSGARCPVPAQVAGEACAALEEEGRLTASNLVEASRPEDAPLHKAFEWNDAEAAEHWREHQARVIIASIVCVQDDKQKLGVRAFFNIEEASPVYESIDAIVRNEDKRATLLQMALKELRAFQKKYSQLKELSAVLAEIAKIA